MGNEIFSNGSCDQIIGQDSSMQFYYTLLGPIINIMADPRQVPPRASAQRAHDPADQITEYGTVQYAETYSNAGVTSISLRYSIYI